MSIQLFTRQNNHEEILNDIDFGHFPDHTQVIRALITSEMKLAQKAKIVWQYESDEEMATLYFLTKHLQSRNIQVSLQLPYVPNARFDRVNNDDEVFTLKYFAEFINNLNFEHVLVLDVHSNVSLALLNRVVQLPVGDLIEKAIRISRPDVLFMPDEGAHKRYTSLNNNVLKTMPSTFGIKHRDWRTGDILNYAVAEPDMVQNKKVLIIDDISSKGGTFYFAAQELLRVGATSVDLYITHSEETITQGKLLGDSPISHIYVANPLFDISNQPRMTQIPWKVI